MKFLLLIFICMECVTAAAQVAILQVNMSFTNRTEAQTFRLQMKTLSDATQLTFSNSTEQAWGGVTNVFAGGTNYTIIARRAYSSTNDMNIMLLFFQTNVFPATAKGLVSIHRCPADGSAIANWLGCKDPRAQYREKTWP